jgi:hypothetical protein
MADSIVTQPIQEIGDDGAGFPVEDVEIITDGVGTTIVIGGANSGQAFSLVKITRIKDLICSSPYIVDPSQTFVTISGLTLNARIGIRVRGEKVLT